MVETAEIVKKAYLVKALEPLLNDFLSEGGISKKDMLDKIGLLVGKSPDSPEVDILSLNFVGSLRSVGYIVSGGRYKKLGDKYRILGFQTPEVKPTVDQWDEPAQRLLGKIHDLCDLLGPDNEQWFREILPESNRSLGPLHEMSWLYYLCYEMGGKSQGFVWFENDLQALIFQRDRTRPSFRIVPLVGEPSAVYNLAQKLGTISVSNVKIVNATMDEVTYFRDRHPNLYWERGKQAVYSCEDIWQQSGEYLNERACTTLRKNRRLMTFNKQYGSDEELGLFDSTQATNVIERWRKYNEPKQRQLAITRDYLAVTARSEGKIFIQGFREGYPSCLHILDRLVTHPEYAAQIVEKSLNYSAILGGAPGTADLNLVTTCEYLLELGIKFLNAGMYNGGTTGLVKHKLRFRFSEETDEASISISAPFRREE